MENQTEITNEYTPLEKYCIVRCTDAGVWAGTVKKIKARECVLTNARRLWSWTAANGHTLSAVAIYGIKDGKLPAPVPIVFLQETCEIIPCSDASKSTIQKIKEHNV